MKSDFRGAARHRRPYFWVILLPLLLSCVRHVPADREARIIEGVPFYPQEEYQCGPASLAGVMSFWGVKTTPGEIGAAIYSASARGTWDLDLVLYARKKGLNATLYQGSPADVRKNIDASRPLIAMVDYGFWKYEKNHFMVIVGYSLGGVIVNSGKNRYEQISWKDFQTTWTKTGNWILLVTPS